MCPNIHSSIYSCQVWKQANCLSTDEWIKKICTHTHTHTHTHMHTYNGMLLSQRKDWNFAICCNIDGLRGHWLSEISQRTTKSLWYHLHLQSKKIHQTSEYMKHKQTHRYRKQTSVYQWERESGGAIQGKGINR